MKSVLMSINPKWCKLIASGKKTVEVRKTRPKINVPFKCYIYCTKNGKSLIKNDISTTIGFIAKNGGKVIGEFVCDAILSHCEMANADIAEIQGRIKREKLLEYSNGKEIFGWHISDLVIYDKPKDLTEFKRVCDGNCQSCRYAIWQTNGWAYEPYIVDCKPITRPPQSWCYVEE
ncbi:MAG: ASCH domain-containing protein [Clostridia bacterium]|nr:ASCH domain-containing protein [Clostridia bacterium]